MAINKNIYYVQVTFINERNYSNSGIYEPIVLVIADSENDALTIIRNFLSKYKNTVEVTLPYKIDNSGNRVYIDNLADFGHGMNVREYLTDPESANKFDKLTDIYKDHYRRYDMHIFDERGEILLHNEYTQDPNFTMPPQPPKNIMVVIPSDQIDRLESGVALVGNEEEGNTSGSVLIAQKITHDDGSYTINQSLLGPDGATKVRTYDSNSNTWSDWKVSESSYVVDAPLDGREYVRIDAGWKAIEYDEEPTASSEKLVKSGNIKNYVETKVAKLYKYMGTVDTLADLPSDSLVIGHTYNVKQESSLVMTVDGENITIEANAGDNVVWNGKYWDNLSGFIDVDSIKEYVDNKVNEIISPSVGVEYQKQYDSNLKTDAKTVVGAINELNNKVNTVSGKLQTGWNNVSLNVLYPLSWTFLDKPYVYTDDGVSVDYRVKNLAVSTESVKNNMNTFDIYVPCDCNYVFSTTTSNEISGYPIDYLVVSYYYTGADGQDLDTITGIDNENWSLDKNTVGWTGGSSNSIIQNSSGVTLIQWGGDNQGGGIANATTKYYESVYFNIKSIQEQLPDEDIDVILYGTWYNTKGEGNIHVSLECYTCSTIPTVSVNDNTKIITLTGDDLVKTYSNDNNLICQIATKRGNPSDYKNAYTPAFKITFKRVTDASNYRTIKIQPLS